MTAQQIVTHPINQPLPPLEDVFGLARVVARYFAPREDDIDDLIQIGLIAYHKMLERHVQSAKPWALAKTILQRAMVSYSYVYHQDTHKWVAIQTRMEWARSVPLEQEIRVADKSQMDLFALEEYYEALERACGHTARVMIENLVSPSNPRIVGYILSESRAKLEQRRNSRATERRKLPRGGGSCRHSIRISQTTIRLAMGLMPWEWTREMKRVREFTSGWLLRNGSD